MDKSWIDTLTDEFRGKVIEIANVWNDIGVINEKYVARSNSLKLHVLNLLNDMIKEEHQHKYDVEKSIDTLAGEIKELCTDLKMDCKCDLSGSLVKRESVLLTKKTELMKIKDQRMEKFHTLLECENELCQTMFEYKLNLDPKLIPSEYQLEKLSQKISELEQIKINRTNLYLSKRSEVIKYFSLLEKVPPKDAFIESVLGEDSVKYVPLSTNFLDQCDLLISNLKAEYQKNITECTSLRDRYDMLSKILFPSSDQPLKDYQSKSSDNFTNKTLALLKSDVATLEIARQDRIGEFITTYQSEIRKKLQKNFSTHLECTDEYRLVLGSTEISDRVLEQLETLLERWSKIELDLEPFHKEIANWNRLFNKLIEIYKNLKDPIVRKNRGGILLKVEKEKNAVRKELPKSESKMRAILERLHHELDEPIDLRFQGLSLDEYLSHSWDQLDGDKENKKVKTTNVSSSVVLGSNARFDNSKTSSSSSISSTSKRPLAVSSRPLGNTMKAPTKAAGAVTPRTIPEFKRPVPPPIDLLSNTPQTKPGAVGPRKGAISKIPSKAPRNPLSPISTQDSGTLVANETPVPRAPHKTNLDRRVSQSQNALFSGSKNLASTRTMAGSIGDMYEMFCKNVEVTSSFVEFPEFSN